MFLSVSEGVRIDSETEKQHSFQTMMPFPWLFPHRQLHRYFEESGESSEQKNNISVYWTS